MDPANPFNNVCHGFSWDEIREEAEEALNSRMLRDVTSTDWDWQNHQRDELVRKPGLQQHPPQDNKPNHNKKKKSSSMQTGYEILVKFLFLLQIVIAYSYSKFLL